MTDRDRISITRPQSEWMRNLTEHELSDFWRGINMARESGMIPNNLHTVVHVLLRWVLSDNGIYYRDFSYEEARNHASDNRETDLGNDGR